PGASGSFTVRIPLPADAGGVSARLAIGTRAGDDGSIPITVRSLVAPGPGGGAFQGTLTGGDGPPGFGAPTLALHFHPPPPRRSTHAAGRRGAAGEPGDEQSTGLAAAGVTTFGTAMQFFARTPRAGRWTLVLALNAPLSGAQVREPFTGRIDFGSVPVSTDG